jgi:single-strand DNA-binding protein
MPSVNKVIVLGHLGRDPETRFLADGSAVCNFSVATSERWKDKNSGEQKESTEWHRISCWGKQAEWAGENLRKGTLVYVEGKLQTRKWTDKDDIERYTTEIRADIVQGVKDYGSAQGDGQTQQRGARPAGTKPAVRPAPAQTVADMDEDVPF